MPTTITCVIPTHGRPDVLARSLASVLAQTRLPDEVVVVDDLDTAASGALVARLAAEHPATPIRYLPIATSAGQPGASRSRNAGARTVTTSHIGFLDDDDEWLPGFLAAVDAALADGADAVVTWMVKHINGVDLDGRLVPPGITADRVLASNPGFTGSNVVIARQVFDALGGFDEMLRISNDKDFLYRFLSAGHRLDVVEQRLMRRHLDAAGRLGTGGIARAAALQAYLRKHESHLARTDRAALERDVLMNLRGDVPSPLVRGSLYLAGLARTVRVQVSSPSGAGLRALVRQRRVARARRRM